MSRKSHPTDADRTESQQPKGVQTSAQQTTMTRSNLNPDPEATSYYERLDISQEAHEKLVDKAGKVAMAEFSEIDTDSFLRVKQAWNVLDDTTYRYLYDSLVSDFGIEAGTKVFEDWQHKGEPPIQGFIDRIDTNEES